MKRAGKEKNKGGRPSKYKPEYAEIAKAVCAELGATDENLAKVFKVSVWSIDKWKQRFPAFLQSIKQGKDEFDTEKVEASLLKRALGYEVIETHKTLDETGETITKEVIKNVISDTAILFWLKNRHPARWRDIKALELTGRDGEQLESAVIILPDNGRSKNEATGD